MRVNCDICGGNDVHVNLSQSGYNWSPQLVCGECFSALRGNFSGWWLPSEEGIQVAVDTARAWSSGDQETLDLEIERFLDRVAPLSSPSPKNK